MNSNTLVNNYNIIRDSINNNDINNQFNNINGQIRVFDNYINVTGSFMNNFQSALNVFEEMIHSYERNEEDEKINMLIQIQSKMYYFYYYLLINRDQYETIKSQYTNLNYGSYTSRYNDVCSWYENNNRNVERIDISEAKEKIIKIDYVIHRSLVLLFTIIILFSSELIKWC